MTMTAPAPNPEESLGSIVCRTARANGSASGELLWKEIFRGGGIAEFAELLRVDSETLLRRHSLAPYFFARYDPQHLYRNPSSNNRFRVTKLTAGLGPGRAGYCRQCVGEDLDWFGFSYWRRYHQIPGVRYCPKHQSTLEIANADQREFLPHDVMRSTAKTAVADEQSLAWRLTVVFTSVLSDKIHVPMEGFEQKFAARAAEAGVSSTYKHNVKAFGLADHMRVRFSNADITEIEHCLSDLTLRALQPGAKFVPSEHTSTETAGLAAVLLQDTIDDAIEWLAERPELERRQKHPAVSEAQVKRAYARSAGQVTEVAKCLGVTYPRAKEICSRFGLPALKKSTEPAILKSMADFLDGTPLKDAVASHQADAAEVEKYLRQCMRPAATVLGRYR